MFKKRLSITSGIIILFIMGSYYIYWLIPEKLVKHVYFESLRSPQTFSTKMQNYIIDPDGCIQLAKNIPQDLKEKVFLLPANLKRQEVRYIYHQRLGKNLMVYYVSAMPRYEDKIKVDARILLIRTNYKWQVKSINIDSISPIKPQPQPSFISY
ncbi:MAG: hypothetical protein GX790_10205 [Syntrophomonadaceae bacterium]|nr:hypothetical protein [Syntrophomonadaceae bacterium]